MWPQRNIITKCMLLTLRVFAIAKDDASKPGENQYEVTLVAIKNSFDMQLGQRLMFQRTMFDYNAKIEVLKLLKPII